MSAMNPSSVFEVFLTLTSYKAVLELWYGSNSREQIDCLLLLLCTFLMSTSKLWVVRLVSEFTDSLQFFVSLLCCVRAGEFSLQPGLVQSIL